MSIAELIRRMSDAGATPEAIAIAVERIEAGEKANAERRAEQARKKREYRERARTRTIPDTAETVKDSPKDTYPSEPASLTLLPREEKKERKDEPSVRPKRQVATRLPDGWAPDEVSFQFALSEGLLADQVEREVQRFRDYWHGRAGSAGCKLDWPATWRNWVRKAADDARRGRGGERGRNDTRRSVEFLGRLRERAAADELFDEGGGGARPSAPRLLPPGRC